MQVAFKFVFSFCLDRYSRGGIARSCGSFIFNFWGASKLFSIMAIPVYIPTVNKGSLSSKSSPTLIILCLFDNWYSNREASRVALVVKNPPANAGNIRGADSIPGSGRFPGGGHGNPLQYSCVGNLPETEEPGGRQSGLQRVGLDWSNLAHSTF